MTTEKQFVVTAEKVRNGLWHVLINGQVTAEVSSKPAAEQRRDELDQLLSTALPASSAGTPIIRYGPRSWDVWTGMGWEPYDPERHGPLGPPGGIRWKG